MFTGIMIMEATNKTISILWKTVEEGKSRLKWNVCVVKSQLLKCCTALDWKLFPQSTDICLAAQLVETQV